MNMCSIRGCLFATYELASLHSVITWHHSIIILTVKLHAQESLDALKNHTYKFKKATAASTAISSAFVENACVF